MGVATYREHLAATRREIREVTAADAEQLLGAETRPVLVAESITMADGRTPFPDRNLIVFLTFGVILITHDLGVVAGMTDLACSQSARPRGRAAAAGDLDRRPRGQAARPGASRPRRRRGARPDAGLRPARRPRRVSLAGRPSAPSEHSLTDCTDPRL